MPAAAQLEQQAAAAPSRPGREGVLEKKSGGKDGKEKMKLLQKWDKRFFALAPGATQLKYYKSADAMRKGDEPLGDRAFAGAGGSNKCERFTRIDRKINLSKNLWAVTVTERDRIEVDLTFNWRQRRRPGLFFDRRLGVEDVANFV